MGNEGGINDCAFQVGRLRRLAILFVFISIRLEESVGDNLLVLGVVTVEAGSIDDVFAVLNDDVFGSECFLGTACIAYR